FGRCAGELAGGFETHRLYLVREDGALRIESTAASRAYLCVYSKRTGLSAAGALLGNISHWHQFYRRSGRNYRVSRKILARKKARCARQPHGDRQRRAHGARNDRFHSITRSEIVAPACERHSRTRRIGKAARALRFDRQFDVNRSLLLTQRAAKFRERDVL